MGGRSLRHPHTPPPSSSIIPSWRQPALFELIHGVLFSVQNERRGYSDWLLVPVLFPRALLACPSTRSLA